MPNRLSASKPPRSGRNYQSVKRLLVILIGSVFFIEAFVMNIMQWLPPTHKTISALLDAAVLSLLLIPIFYYLIFRPLVQDIAERKKTEDDLRIAAEIGRAHV